MQDYILYFNRKLFIFFFLRFNKIFRNFTYLFYVFVTFFSYNHLRELNIFLSLFFFFVFTYLMPRSFLAVKASLYRNRAVFVDEKLSLPIGASVDGIGDLALTTLIRISSLERFQAAAYSGVLRYGGLDIGFLELRLIVVDISQLHDYPGVSNVIFVVVVVLALKTQDIGFFFSRNRSSHEQSRYLSKQNIFKHYI